MQFVVFYVAFILFYFYILHLKFCPSSAINALIEILNLAFAHSFLLASMLDVRLTPIVKKKVYLIIRVEIIGLLL